MAISSMSLFLKDISYLAYISQYDLHISKMTVRETLHFSAWCQGIGGRPSRLCFASYGYNHALMKLGWSYMNFFTHYAKIVVSCNRMNSLQQFVSYVPIQCIAMLEIIMVGLLLMYFWQFCFFMGIVLIFCW